MFLLRRFHNLCAFRGYRSSSSAASQVRQFKVALDGQTLYIEKPLAEALGWNPGTGNEGVSLRLSGWEPKFFAITPTDTDVGMCFVLVRCLTSVGHTLTRSNGRLFGSSNGGEQQKSSSPTSPLLPQTVRYGVIAAWRLLAGRRIHGLMQVGEQGER